jgi:hypothetical protein
MVRPAFAQVNIGQQFWFRNQTGVAIIFPNIGTLVNILLHNVYIIAGILLFLLLFFGGFMVIAGAGGGNPEQTARGGKAVGAALIGFLIIFLSYWIIKIVEIVTGLKILEPGI